LRGGGQRKGAGIIAARGARAARSGRYGRERAPICGRLWHNAGAQVPPRVPVGPLWRYPGETRAAAAAPARIRARSG